MHVMFSGENIFAILPIENNRVRFIYKENFKGLRMLLYTSSFDRNVKQGLREMNRALKAMAEQKV